VIMPAYNASAYIAATINSIVNQTVDAWELIIVNDASSDNTAAIVNTFVNKDRRIKLINLSKNFGAPAAPRNIGVRAAVGKWIAFIDDDDIWHPQKLDLQMKALKETSAKFCSSIMMDFEGGIDFSYELPEKILTKQVTFLQQLIHYSTPTSSVVVLKDLMLDSPFNEDMEYKAQEDLDCWLRIHSEIPYSIKLMLPLVGYRVRGNQISANKVKMLKRHYFVLSRFSLKNGRKMGIGALLFTMTHAFYSIYFRLYKRQL